VTDERRSRRALRSTRLASLQVRTSARVALLANALRVASAVDDRTGRWEVTESGKEKQQAAKTGVCGATGPRFLGTTLGSAAHFASLPVADSTAGSDGPRGWHL
jgi:hypothetical protein